MHYGDITMTFLDNWFRADQRGTALTYASAVAVEEKSVIDYNRGNPDGILEPGEEERPPRIPHWLPSIPPWHLLPDNPPFTSSMPTGVTEDQRAGAELFTEFVSTVDNQEKVLEFVPTGHRGAPGSSDRRSQRVDPGPAPDPAGRKEDRCWWVCWMPGDQQVGLVKDGAGRNGSDGRILPTS
ncbi:MAG: hypothetical protein R2789_06785 [Microthrixaceae bacterium]